MKFEKSRMILAVFAASILALGTGCQQEKTKKSSVTVETKNSKTEIEVKKTEKKPDRD